MLMIHGYHVILPMYGFWLPNDPRGSWSDFVWAWELVRFGKATKTIERRDIMELTQDELQEREAARNGLKYEPVSINGQQALSIANGFGFRAKRSNYSIWACAILPEHTHLVLARHTYIVEQMAKLLKAAATTEIVKVGRHPLQKYKAADGSLPHMWAESQWKVYLDSEEQIENAIRYVNENPEREGKNRQHWSFISPFRGLEPGHITYH